MIKRGGKRKMDYKKGFELLVKALGVHRLANRWAVSF